MQHFIAVIPPSHISGPLRQVGVHRLVGPHITVKAQPGLIEENKHVWMQRLNSAVKGFGSVDIKLGPLASFGDRVAYLEVASPRLHDLHNLLLRTIGPAPDEAKRYFESDGWTPHLTLQQGCSIDFEKLRSALCALDDLPTFTVDTLWVCRQDQTGQPYYPEISLGLQ